jgi:hypothetical protein
MRPRETIGITARDTLSRHGRPCPGHPDAVRRGALRIEITGTSPVMTWRMSGPNGASRSGSGKAKPGTVIPQRPGSITAAALQWGLPTAPDSHPRGNDNTEGRASNLPHSRTACPVVDDDGESRRRQHFSSA